MYVNSFFAFVNEEKITGLDANLLHTRFNDVNVSMQVKFDWRIAVLSTTKITACPDSMFCVCVKFIFHEVN